MWYIIAIVIALEATDNDYLTYVHTHIHTYIPYINKFITRNTVKQSSNQRRGHGQSLGGGSLGDEGIKIK